MQFFKISVEFGQIKVTGVSKYGNAFIKECDTMEDAHAWIELNS